MYTIAAASTSSSPSRSAIGVGGQQAVGTPLLEEVPRSIRVAVVADGDQVLHGAAGHQQHEKPQTADATRKHVVIGPLCPQDHMGTGPILSPTAPR